MFPLLIPAPALTHVLTSYPGTGIVCMLPHSRRIAGYTHVTVDLWSIITADQPHKAIVPAIPACGTQSVNYITSKHHHSIIASRFVHEHQCLNHLMAAVVIFHQLQDLRANYKSVAAKDYSLCSVIFYEIKSSDLGLSQITALWLGKSKLITLCSGFEGLSTCYSCHHYSV